MGQIATFLPPLRLQSLHRSTVMTKSRLDSLNRDQVVVSRIHRQVGGSRLDSIIDLMDSTAQRHLLQVQEERIVMDTNHLHPPLQLNQVGMRHLHARGTIEDRYRLDILDHLVHRHHHHHLKKMIIAEVQARDHPLSGKLVNPQ